MRQVKKLNELSKGQKIIIRGRNPEFDNYIYTERYLIILVVNRYRDPPKEPFEIIMTN